MIRLSTLIEQFETSLLSQYSNRLLPSHKKALSAMKICRSKHSPLMLAKCTDCGHDQLIPHSCGHRNCPHCQSHESQQWIERQSEKQVPASYFMITFTLPKELRALVWQHQRQLYTLMFQSVWDTLRTFSQNDKQLKGTPGVIAVLHTHSRALEYHPHIHTVIPAAAMDKQRNVWRKKQGKYLFNHNALAMVFRAKCLEMIKESGLTLPQYCPKKWIVDCRAVGAGDKTIIYLGRYLYRGVIQEKDILSSENGKVTYRYKNSKTKYFETRTVSGAHFLWLLLQHVLPKGLRRARNYGFLHPNSKRLIQHLQILFKLDPKKWIAKIKTRAALICQCCGACMQIVRTRIPVSEQIIQTRPT